MGDMGAVFRDMKAAKKVQREKRASVNIEALNNLGFRYRVQGPNVFRFETGLHNGPVMYYPSSNCWQHAGKTHRGSIEHFGGWFRAFCKDNGVGP